MANDEVLPAVRDEVHLVTLMLPTTERRNAVINCYIGGAIYLTEYLGEVGEHYQMPPCQRWLVPSPVFQAATRRRFLIGVEKGGFRSHHEYSVTEIGLEMARSQLSQEAVAK